MKKIITLVMLVSIFSGCSTTNVQQPPESTNTPPTIDKPTENENPLTYQSDELGISMQYPAKYGKPNESKYKNLDLRRVEFIDDNGDKTELSLSPRTFESGDLPISSEELTELSYGPADFNTTPKCDNFPEGGFTSGDIMIKKCEEFNVDNQPLIIITEVIAARGYDNSEDGKRAILQTKKGVWTISAPEQDLTSIVESLQYI